jgi:hypothetical protein
LRAKVQEESDKELERAEAQVLIKAWAARAKKSLVMRGRF